MTSEISEDSRVALRDYVVQLHGQKIGIGSACIPFYSTEGATGDLPEVPNREIGFGGNIELGT